MKNLLKGRILLLLIFILGAGILYSANISVGYLNRINTLQSELAVQAKKYKELEDTMQKSEIDMKNEIAAIQGELTAANMKLENLPQLQKFEVEQLKQEGLNDPIKDLKEDLLTRTDLIPYKGVLGGTMGFYSEDNIYIISSKWAAAYFNDGHIGGIMLLRYSILNNGRIHWSVIDSFIYQ